MKNSLLLGLLALSCTTAAHADLSYTQTTTTTLGGMLGSAGGSTTKAAFKGGAVRMEMNTMGSKTIMITPSPGGKTMQLDPATKTYTVSDGFPKMPSGPHPNMGPTEMTVSVKKLPNQNIRGVNAPHWRVDMTLKSSSPQGPHTMNVGTEIWSSTTPYPQSPGAGNAALKKLPANMMAMFGNNVKIKGDVKSLGAAYTTVPLRMKILMQGQEFGTTDTTNISTKPLPASLFAVPAGYKQVSSQQFSQARQKAMMKNMGNIFKGLPGGMKGLPDMGH